MLILACSLSRSAEGLVVLPVLLLVGRRAVEDCPAAGAPQEALARLALVEALDAHRQRFHLVLELIKVHGDELKTAEKPAVQKKKTPGV